jgi:subtilisin family serine protease
MKIFYAAISLIFILSFTTLHAQYTKHVVRLTDKGGTLHSISNPSTYLSSKAILRRTKQNIAVDSTDIPVSPAYLDSIRNTPNVTILNYSKWLNQVLIQVSDPAALSKVNSFPFVKNSQAIAAVPKPQDEEIINRRFKETVTPLPDRSLINERNRQSGLSESFGNTYNYGNNAKQVHIHEGEYLHNLGFTGHNITMAFCDAGFFGYKTNPVFDSVRLQNRILGEYDFVKNEQSVNEDHVHGMYCFSTVAANKPGTIVGTAPNAKFWLFRTEEAATEFPIEEQYWAVAAEFADSVGADMLSTSLGYAEFSDPTLNHQYAQRDGNSTMITIAADLAAKKGMIVMNSAGNSGLVGSDYKYVASPADGDSVVAVGSTDVNGNISAFSSWGPNSAGKLKPNIVSVGEGVVVANTAGNVVSGNGTSFASPNVGGLIACLWQAFPEYGNMEIIDEVQRSSHRYSNPDPRFGYGIPNFRKAFYSLLARSFSGDMVSSECGITLNWISKDNKTMKYEIERKMEKDTGFIKIATINGKTDSFASNAYSYKDVLTAGMPAEQVSYRLKQLTTPDTSVIMYANAIALTDICALGNRLVIHPNPFQGSINLILGTTQPVSNLSVLLTDLYGRILYKYEASKSPGNLYLNIPAVSLRAGIYFLTVKEGKKILYIKTLVKPTS